MHQYMMTVRASRFARIRLVTVHERTVALSRAWYDVQLGSPRQALVPTAEESARLPFIRSLICAPAQVVVDEDVLRRALHRNADVLGQWHHGRLQSLCAKLDVHLPGLWRGQAPEQFLGLAVCVLSCRVGGNEGVSPCDVSSVLWYPEFLHRRCISGFSRRSLVPTLSGEGSYCTDEWSVVPFSVVQHDQHVLSFHVAASSITRRLLECCAIDPNVVTVAMLQAGNIRVSCSTCVGGGEGQRFTWIQAVCSTFQFSLLHCC